MEYGGGRIANRRQHPIWMWRQVNDAETWCIRQLDDADMVDKVVDCVGDDLETFVWTTSITRSML